MKVKKHVYGGVLIFMLLCVSIITVMLPNSGTAKSEAASVSLDDYLIGSWVSYYDIADKSYADQTKEMAEAGINYVSMPGRNHMAQYDHKNIAYWKGVDAIFKQNNMMYTLMDYFEEANGLNATNIAQMVNWTKELDNAAMFHVIDEPPISRLTEVTDLAKLFINDANNVKKILPYINLLPSYAGAHIGTKGLENYFQLFVDAMGGAKNVEYLSFDHYPFTINAGEMKEAYYSDLEALRKVGYNNGKIKTSAFSQMHADSGHRFPNLNEARLNMYSMVGYGVKFINHFNWVLPSPSPNNDFKNAIVMPGGVRSSLYDPMSEMNWDIRAMGDILMQLDAKNVYHSGSNIPSGVSVLPADYFVKPRSNAQNLMISYMENKKASGEDHIFITNKDTENKIVSSIMFDKNVVSGLSYFDPATKSYKVVDVSNGSFVDAFLPGEGKLYKLSNKVNDSTVATPISSLAEGIFTSAQTTTLTAAVGTEIYYTLDGTKPSKASMKYTAPITISPTSQTVKLKTVAISASGSASAVATYEYTFMRTEEFKGTLLHAKNLAANTMQSAAGAWGFNEELTVLVQNLEFTHTDANPFSVCGMPSISTLEGEPISDSGIGKQVYVEAELKFEDSSAVLASEDALKAFMGFELFGSTKTSNAGNETPVIRRIGIYPNGKIHVGNYDTPIGYDAANAPVVPNFDNTKAFKLGVLIDNGNLKVYVNGTKYYDFTDESYNKNGYFSIFAGKFKLSATNMHLYNLVKSKSVSNIVSKKDIMLENGAEMTELTSKLPAEVDLILSDGTKSSLPVTWNTEKFDTAVAGFYSIEGTVVLPDGVVNESNVKPTVCVYVKNLVDFTQINVLIEKFRGFTNTQFTAISWDIANTAYASAAVAVANPYSTQSDIDAQKSALEAGIKQLVRSGIDKTSISAQIAAAKALVEAEYIATGYAELKAALENAEKVLGDNLSTQLQLNTAANNLKNKIASLKKVVTSVTGGSAKELEIGKDIVLTVVIEPSGAEAGVTWTTSDATIATVDESGKVTAIKEGAATIVATSKQDNTKKTTFTITVTKEVITPPEEQKKGCNSTLNTVSIVATILLLVLALSIVMKKKKA